MRIQGAFNGPDTEFSGLGKRPVIFDILAPDGQSILPPEVRLVLHVNPASMQLQYTASVDRQITMGGWVECDWGQSPTSISASGVSGGFLHLHNGLMAITGPTPSSANAPYGDASISVGGTRRQTLAYSKFLDLLALFQGNAAVYDQYGRVVYQGAIKMSYHGAVYIGWFESFEAQEDAQKQYQISYSFSFKVKSELLKAKSIQLGEGGF
jgi:hypothetical protein